MVENEKSLGFMCVTATEISNRAEKVIYRNQVSNVTGPIPVDKILRKSDR